MSSRNNVNPDHYKTAGRMRQGDPGTQELEKQKYTQARAGTGPEPANLIPGAQPAMPSNVPRNEEEETEKEEENEER
ncbi:MAG TPA: hypothetical protein VNQ79_17525 [Blastocatellia bacterium]|nr:hypothetical protein [Blastocatellia bacterium]